MNVPNTLTLSRLVLAGVMMVFLTLAFPLAKSLALLVFVAAGITDYLDGHLARTTYGVTTFGRLMDPLTDKVLTCAAFVSFVELRLIPAWIAVIIISREFLVTGLRLVAAHKGMIIPAGKWGKHKTVWQIIAIVLLLLGLAVRDDLLRHLSTMSLDDYNTGFHFIAYGVGVAVSLITLVTGGAYFMQHRELIARHM